MKEINITHSDLAAAMGHKCLTKYMTRVVDAGHEPGVLSGAELRGGKAKKYAAHYAQTRSKVSSAVRQLTGINSEFALIGSLWVRVWVDEEGNRVKLTVTTE